MSLPPKMAAALQTKVPQPIPAAEVLRLEGVTVSVGFDDLLDVTLGLNHPHFDQMIVVTSHADTKTQSVARKHGAHCVPTDLFQKNGRTFNKGAAINAGFAYFQYFGWRIHLDADIILPDNFRRLLFNHSALDQQSIYGADRVDIVGPTELKTYLASLIPQHTYGMLVAPTVARPISHRLVSSLYGYLPIGYFQLWFSSCQKDYPYSLGTAAHDDMLFSALWPTDRRHLLPSIILYHLCSQAPQWGENWDGSRQQPRFLR
jgi:hypothetical protein